MTAKPRRSRQPFGGTLPPVLTPRWLTGQHQRPRDGSKTKVLTALQDVRLTRESCGPLQDWTNLGGGLIQLARPRTLTAHCYWTQRGSWMNGNIATVWLQGQTVSIYQIDHYHALAHLLTPPDVPMHGVEFIANLVEIVTECKLEGRTKADSRRIFKAVMKDHKIKTYRRFPKEKSEEQIVADLLKLHQSLTQENP